MSTNNIIAIEASDKRELATVWVDENHQPKLKDVKAKEYEAELNLILHKIENSKLSLQLLPQRKKGSRVIYDRLKYCSPKDADYIYALAHALSYYKLSNGLMIRGKITPAKK